jgi:hypothetical protein
LEATSGGEYLPNSDGYRLSSLASEDSPMIPCSHLPHLVALGSLLAVASASFGADTPKPAAPVPAVEAVDHLLLGVPDLEAGMKWFEEKTGIRPAAGGSHPGRGTRNALVSLGGRHYLEIIAPDPAQAGVDNEMVAGLKKLTAPRLVTWAATSTDLEATIARLDAERVVHSPATPGSRKRPDGRVLAWRVVAVQSDLGETIPFFIDWGTTVHPSAEAPAGARLIALTFRHPKPGALREELARLGIASEVKPSPEPGLAVRLETPRGLISLD